MRRHAVAFDASKSCRMGLHLLLGSLAIALVANTPRIANEVMKRWRFAGGRPQEEWARERR